MNAIEKKSRFFLRLIAEKILRNKLISQVILKIYPIATSSIFSLSSPFSQDDSFRSRIDTLLDLIDENIERINCLVRLGNQNDGGYVIADIFPEEINCISLGVGGDVSFEYDLQTRVNNIHMYDHTVERLPQEIERGVFFRKGISDIESADFITLEKCISKFGLECELLLKIDIEGSEWKVLDATSTTDISRFTQIVGEFHNFHRINENEIFFLMREVLTKLSLNHSVVNVHANNWGNFEIISNQAVPDVIEITFVRKDLLNKFNLENFNNMYKFSGLNQPNNPNNYDIGLRVV